MMNYNEKVGQKFVCLSQAYSAKEAIAAAQLEAQTTCRNTIRMVKEMPVFGSRNEALDYLVREIEALVKQSEGYLKKVKEWYD